MTAVIEIVEASSSEHLESVRNLFLKYREQLWSECQLPDSEWQSLPGAYAPPKGGLLLALVDRHPAGCVGVRSFPREATCEMKRLFVSPEFRGHRLGQKLIAAVIRLARERGYAHMRLDTPPPSMGAAVALYRRFGFRDTDAAPLKPSTELAYMDLDLNQAQPSPAEILKIE